MWNTKKIILTLMFVAPLSQAVTTQNEAESAAIQTATHSFKTMLKMAKASCALEKNKQGEMKVKDPVSCALSVDELNKFNLDEMLKK